MTRCGAKRRNGQPCQQWPLKGRTRCRLHGGRSPLGKGAGGYRHGKYSKFLPARLMANYESAASDRKLLSLRQDIAVTDARIIDILQRVDTGESGALWRELQAVMGQWRQEQAKQHIDGLMLAMTQVDRLIRQGAADHAAWQEIGKLIDRRRKLCVAEQKRVMIAHAVLTSEEAMLLMSQVVAAVQKHVSDRRTLSAIAADIQAMVRHGEGSPSDQAAWN